MSAKLVRKAPPDSDAHLLASFVAATFAACVALPLLIVQSRPERRPERIDVIGIKNQESSQGF